jgi:hypothetical protein
MAEQFLVVRLLTPHQQPQNQPTDCGNTPPRHLWSLFSRRRRERSFTDRKGRLVSGRWLRASERQMASVS